MFKRVLSALLTAVLLCSQTAFAYRVEPIQSGVIDNIFSIRQPHFRRVGTSTQSILNYTKGNVLFFNDFSSKRTKIDTANADYSVGSPTATFTATRSASAPATYFDANGVMQVTTTSNVPRFTQGWYTSTGFDPTLKGIVLEGAGTNLIAKSNNVEDAIYTATNITADNDDPGSSSPDGTATAPSLTATADNGTFLLASGVTAQTYSVFLKRKTGTGAVSITANGGTNYTAVTLYSTKWVRVSVSAASASQTCGIKLATNGDAVYVFGNQFENNPYATSFIPTTTASLTRGAEVLKYAIAGNRNAAAESIYITVVPFFNGGDLENYPAVMDTSTKSRRFQFNKDHDALYFYPNATDDIAAVQRTSVPINKFTKYIYCGVSVSPTGNPNLQLYVNGGNLVSGNDDWTAPAWGEYFFVGNNAGGSSTFCGIIQSVLIVGKANSASEVAANTALLDAL